MIDKQDGIILIEMMTECYKQVAYGEISGRSIPNTTYTLVECWCTLSSQTVELPGELPGEIPSHLPGELPGQSEDVASRIGA